VCYIREFRLLCSIQHINMMKKKEAGDVMASVKNNNGSEETLDGHRMATMAMWRAAT
jgi:hypothetical protein